MALEEAEEGAEEREEDEECEVYDDEELNEVIARNDTEFELYTKMDQDRYARENRDERLKLIKEKKPTKAGLADKKVNYRLIQNWEVPQWI